MSIKWRVSSHDGQTVESASEPGRVCLEEHAQTLKIFLLRQNLNDPCLSLHLAESLLAHYNIKNPVHTRMLPHALLEKDLKRIEEYFQREGLGCGHLDDQRSEGAIQADFEQSRWKCDWFNFQPRQEHTTLPNIISSTGEVSSQRGRGTTCLDKTEDEQQHPGSGKPCGESTHGFKKPSEAEQSHSHQTTETILDEAKVPDINVDDGVAEPPFSGQPATQNVEPDTSESPTNSGTSSCRGRTLWPCRQKGRSPSATPSTHYFEKADREASYSPPRSTHSQKQGQSFMNMGGGWMTVPPPMTIFYGDDTEDTKYFGELCVSRYLESFLGKGVYQSKQHWTSPLCFRRDIPRYTAEPYTSTSTFTIENTAGKLRDAIISCEHIPSNALAECITVHIEVCTTKHGLDMRFGLPVSQYEKLKKMHLRRQTGAVDVYILARVYRVRENPTIAMFADPWQLHLDGAITLETVHNFTGRIDKSTPTMLPEAVAPVSLTAGTSKIYDGLALGLGKIRLLKLQHVDDDSTPLGGSLEVADVDDLKLDNGFWAISYAWGHGPEGLSTFTTEKGKVPITESLASCLICLRRKRVDAYIWVDALCINQQDSDEKSIQVRRLGSLYKKAARVIVWLGNDGGMDEPSPEIEWMAEVHRPLCSPGNRCRTRRAAPLANPTPPDPADERWGGVNKLLQRSWFTRAWIVQELAMGGDVSIMSGRSEMKWDCFMESLMECERHFNLGDRTAAAANPKLGAIFLKSSAPAIALHHTRQMYQHAKKIPFLRLLEMFAYTNSSKPRDKMFSLLNLAADPYLSEEDFDPDYHPGPPSGHPYQCCIAVFMKF
ncbi:hypothetical protein FOMA001_g13317 [Fusarium oxysporum f. sp. matthiolae]|nr:hypothetical protein FOMA001_g13317 [Fusarium oxysporum f. sp. matthiolae]